MDFSFFLFLFRNKNRTKEKSIWIIFIIYLLLLLLHVIIIILYYNYNHVCYFIIVVVVYFILYFYFIKTKNTVLEKKTQHISPTGSCCGPVGFVVSFWLLISLCLVLVLMFQCVPVLLWRFVFLDSCLFFPFGRARLTFHYFIYYPFTTLGSSSPHDPNTAL